MACLHNLHCQGNATMSSFFTELYVMFNNIQYSKVSREMQQWVFLYCSRAMYIAVNNTDWYVDLHVKCLILQSFNKFGFCWQILMKDSHIKLHKNPSSRGWVVTCRWWMEVTKLLGDCCNYLNVTTKTNFFIASVPHASSVLRTLGWHSFLI